MFVNKVLPVMLGVVLLAGCNSTGHQTKTEDGAVIIGGAIQTYHDKAGSTLASSGVSSLLGAFMGKDIGTSLDAGDRELAVQAARRAYSGPVGDRVGWANQANGHGGAVTTTRDGYNSQGQYCREFQQSVTVGKRTENAYGTACKQSDGTWKIVAAS